MGRLQEIEYYMPMPYNIQIFSVVLVKSICLLTIAGGHGAPKWVFAAGAEQTNYALVFHQLPLKRKSIINCNSNHSVISANPQEQKASLTRQSWLNCVQLYIYNHQGFRLQTKDSMLERAQRSVNNIVNELDRCCYAVITTKAPESFNVVNVIMVHTLSERILIVCCFLQNCV